MKIRKINKIVALFTILVMTVMVLEPVYAQYETLYKEVTENKRSVKETVEIKTDNKDNEKAEASVVKELKNLRTTNSTTYLLSDGSRKLEMSSTDIRYEEDGKLKDYISDLKTLSKDDIKELEYISGENEIILEEKEISDYIYVNTAGDSKQYFPKMFDRDTKILLKKDDYMISFVPMIVEQEDANENKQLQDVKQNLKNDSAPLNINNVEENNITYLDKGRNIEYKYTSLPDGVKEEIILKEKPDNNIFEFNLNLSGIKIEKAQFGKGLNFIDEKTNATVALIGEPNIKEKDGELRYEEISYGVENLEDGNYILKVIVDDNYLKSSDTKYPVTIDPTVAWVDSRLPCVNISNNSVTANSNIKINTYFPVQNRAMDIATDLDTEYMCYISTNSSPASGGSDPIYQQFYGSKIESANLKIVEYSISSPYKPGTIEVRTPSGLWNPDTITWNNHPEVGSKVWAQFTTTGTQNKRYDVNLTSWAQAVADREITNYGLALKAKNKGTGAYFYGPWLSKTNGNYLELVIIYYPYTATVNNYYDNAYDVRYSQSKYGSTNPVNMIKSYQDWANNVFSVLFGLKITSNIPQKYTSLADRCKLNQGMAISTTSMNRQCPGGVGHGFISDNNEFHTKCTTAEAAHKSFVENKPSNDNCCNILWTGNQMYLENGDTYDRAWLWYNSVFIFEPLDPSERIDIEKRTIVHELAHNFGAPDEYCYNENNPSGGECSAAGCPKHHPERFIGKCIMGNAMYDGDRISNVHNIFCRYCMEDIKNHLDNHHRVSPLVITPNTGETIGKAIKKALGTTNEKTIKKIKITGNAVLGSGTENSDFANILTNLEEVDLSGFTGKLGTHSFYNCPNLKMVKLPTSIELPSFTFAFCKKLTTVYKTESTKVTGEIDLSGVKSVGDSAFQNTAVTTVKLPENLAIPQFCFTDCKNLRKIYKTGNSPIDGEADLSGVTSLGVGAFWDSSSYISSVDLPKNVPIQASCFQNWTNLKEVRFDISQISKVTIGASAFFGVNSSCIAYMNQALVNDKDFIVPMSYTKNMPKQISPLIITPSAGETIGQAIIRELGTIPADSIKKIILRGNAVMAASAGSDDSARILPNLESADLSGFKGTLGNFVFFNCSNLKTVILPDNVKIPDNAFRDCIKLTSIQRKNTSAITGEIDLSGVTSIGNFAFRNAESISVVKLPTSFTISQYCFMECKNLRTIYKTGNPPVEGEIDLTGVTDIGYAAFYNNLSNINEAPKFNTVKLSESTSIPANCFRNSANLTTIYKSGSEKVIGEADLSGVKSFGGGAFSGTGSLNAPQMSSVILPKNVSIPLECFLNCGNLKKLQFDETQTAKTSIGDSAFYGVNESCIAYMNQTLVKDLSFILPISDKTNMPKQLYALIITPNSGETMKQAITRELGTIAEGTVKKMKVQGSAVMGAGFSNDDSARILSELESVDLSEYKGTLGSYAFHTCKKLKTVILPTGNIKLPLYAFSDCENLDTVYKFGSVPVIGEVDLSGVVSAGNYAFMNTAINKVKLPSTFAIPQYCFIACKNLSTIYRVGTSQVTGLLDLSGISDIGYGAFWNYFGNIPKFNTIKLPESISVGGNCFRSCGNLTTIYKNGKTKVNGEADLSGITSFGGGAFSGTSVSNAPQITVVYLPKNIAISESCFQNCSNLKKVKFDETQIQKVVIGASAFYGVNGACVAYMNQILVNDVNFVLPMSPTLNMTKSMYTDL